VAAQNAVWHGLLAQEVVVKGGDPGEFECYREQMLAELAPAGLMEETLAQRIVGLSWRLRRAERLQTLAYDKIETKSEQAEPTMSPEDAAWLIARMLERGLTYQDLAGSPLGERAVVDFNQERVLDRLLVYERRIEHSLYRTMAELRKLRKEGGVSSGKGEEGSLCQTNPIGPGVSSLKSEVSGGDPVLPTSSLPLETSDKPPEGGSPDKACRTRPIPEPESAPKKTPAEPPRPRMYPNTAREMTYDFCLRRWVWTGYDLANRDSKPGDAGRRQ
jgi:hypothetical protein